jgi:Outer membrane protein
VPIYQGGAEYAAIRQAKETLGQRRLDLDTARDQVQATVTQAWGQLEAAKAQIDATQSQVTAAEVALNGVREEARVGQRTTLDVSTPSRTSSMPAWRSSPRNATASLPPIQCWRRLARSRR